MFNEHLKRIRKVSKKTQQELAEFLNISAQSVSKWEKGTALPSIEFLPKIANFYNCSVNAFFSAYELQLYEQFEALDEHQLNDLLLTIISSQSNVKCDEQREEIPENVEETIPLETLFLPALYTYLQNHEILSIRSLQRELSIGYGLGSKIVDALRKIGVIEEDRVNKRFFVIKEKIELLLPYMREK